MLKWKVSCKIVRVLTQENHNAFISGAHLCNHTHAPHSHWIHACMLKAQRVIADHGRISIKLLTYWLLELGKLLRDISLFNMEGRFHCCKLACGWVLNNWCLTEIIFISDLNFCFSRNIISFHALIYCRLLTHQQEFQLRCSLVCFLLFTLGGFLSAWVQLISS